MHLFVIPDWINWSTTLLVPALAFWKGAWREKLLAATSLGAALFSTSLCHLWPCWQGPHPLWISGALVEDVVQLAACLVCVRRATSYWVIWVSALTLLCFISDLMSLMPVVSYWTYRSTNLILAYLVDGLILWGVWTTQRERRAAAGRSPTRG